ncbi:class I SAM-dependent methyltransferase [Lysinibacillus sp. NPDC097195]|uniref:class I SAM-dependent methyltransferase n=1 Tax=Lysinibacillus sp. NPDC097195 TaxID=3364141 RepID=UPI0037F417C7
MTILQKLIEQAKQPRGWIGSVMLRIMNIAHSGMNSWLLDSGVIKDGDIVLDIGCGGGRTIRALSSINHQGEIHGIDFSEQAVNDTTRVNRNDVATGKVIVSQASVANIPYPDAFFDKITACQTHYFWADLASDVKEVYRVLKHGGQFIIMSELYKINYHRKDYKTNVQLKMLLQSIGFQSITIHEHTRKGWLSVIATK